MLAGGLSHDPFKFVLRIGSAGQRVRPPAGVFNFRVFHFWRSQSTMRNRHYLICSEGASQSSTIPHFFTAPAAINVPAMIAPQKKSPDPEVAQKANGV